MILLFPRWHLKCRARHCALDWENTRDTSYWNQQLRAAMQNVYGDPFESLWFKYIDTVKDIYEKRKDGDLCMEEVKRVQCPTLIVHGAKDRLCP